MMIKPLVNAKVRTSTGNSLSVGDLAIEICFFRARRTSSALYMSPSGSARDIRVMMKITLFVALSVAGRGFVQQWAPLCVCCLFLIEVS